MIVPTGLGPHPARAAVGRLRAPWHRTVGWAVASQEVAIGNARAASTELSRQALERHEVELVLAERGAGPPPRSAAVAPRRS